MPAAIRFFYEEVRPNFTAKTKLKELMAGAIKKEGFKLEGINVVFCNDEYLLSINQSFLQHDFYTDIITFDNSEPNTKIINGELYVSLDRVKENAATLGVKYVQELARVLVHGSLHLVGYADKSPKDIKEMRAKEDFYLNLFNYI